MSIRSVAERVAQMARERAPSPAERSEKSEPITCQKCNDNCVVAVIIDTGEEVPIGDIRMWDSKREQYKPHHFRQCSCVEGKRMQNLFKSSQIPEKYKAAGFREFVVEDRPECVQGARDVAVEYYKKFDEIRKLDDNGIAIVGEPGSGKTHLLLAVCNGLMRLGISVLYFPWVEGMDELRRDWDGLDERLDALKLVDVLYIDDLYKGRRAPTDFAKEKIYGVINYRAGNKKPTMVSSEFDFDQLMDIDKGIARRVYQQCRFHRVLMGLTPEEEAAGMVLNYSLLLGSER